ncbi:hypothetical protein HanRHA438_Chr07g0317791 [Helianthus annuus]|nr:hypothetical protein HanRHA438_Chr07g0317791 [Helianthus annuus]
MVPDRLQPPVSNSTIFFQLPKVSGMIPPTGFPATLNFSIDVMFPKKGGIPPVNLLAPSERKESLERKLVSRKVKPFKVNTPRKISWNDSVEFV